MHRCLIFVVLLVGFSMNSAVAHAREEIVYSLGPFDVLGDTRSVLEIGGGRFDVGDGDSTGAAKIEGRLGRKYSFVGPALGAVANRDGGVFGYVGAYVDIAVGRFILTPLGGIGAYHRGNSKDLGGFFIFRSSFSIVYHVTERLGIGATIGHVSNARIYRRNPGQDDFIVSLVVRF